MSRTAAVVSAVLWTVLGIAALAGLVRVAVLTGQGQRLDALALEGGAASAGLMPSWLAFALNNMTVPVLAVCAAAVLVLALARRHWQRAIGAGVMIAGANVTTQALKLLLERPDLDLGIVLTVNSFPSGHATVAASLASALLICSPRWLRPVSAIVALAVPSLLGIGTILEQWHRPSDVIGALLVVAVWTTAVLGFEHATREDPRPTGYGASSFSALLPGIVGLTAAAFCLLLLLGLERPLALDDPGQQLDAFLGTAVGVVAAAGILTGVIASLTDVPGPEPSRGRPEATVYGEGRPRQIRK